MVINIACAKLLSIPLDRCAKMRYTPIIKSERGALMTTYFIWKQTRRGWKKVGTTPERPDLMDKALEAYRRANPKAFAIVSSREPVSSHLPI
jgi:hypothetical protein